MQKEITVSTSKKEELVDITDEVKRIVADSKVKEGLCNVYVPHATAAVTLNENADPNVMVDIVNALDKVVPQGKWLHDRVDGNGDSHIKSAIVGPSETIPIKDGKLLLGTWQDIMLCDFDGPRQRRVIITIK
ncbi:secondary thiamine-phosphate synthase enzyme YjbQ [Candidatus Woesearchaeota archaeon]|nr:secondary thiamine-phosphate synthase enzyme YjbQ [Candidatus Woesearchaeota archaeon]